MDIKRLYWIPLLVIPFLLAGCALIPDATQGATPTSTPSTAAVATQVAAAVAATVSALTPGHTTTGTHHAATKPATSAHDPSTPVATAHHALTTVPASPSATPAPSFTPIPTGTAVPTPVILAPTGLAQGEVGGGPLGPRYWTNFATIAFTLTAAPGTAPGLRPQVEVEPVEHPYTGKPTAEGAPLLPDQPGRVTVQVGTLPEGSYHWQARLSDDNGHNGPWTDYYKGPAFRLDRTPPAAPTITSTTHPDQHQTYSAAMARLSWTRAADNGGIAGYLTSIDRQPAGIPSGPLSPITTTVLGPLASGNLYFHVRAQDWAGNLGAIATFALHIDHRPPTLAHAYFERFQFNPQFDKLTMHFVPDKSVTLHVEIRRQATKGLVRILDLGAAAAGKKATVQWDGRNARGLQVQPGLYTMVVYATDRLGNVGDGYYSNLAVNYRHIVVHLGTQSMDIYDGTTLVRSTLVTTGNALLPTPLGTWHIGGKFHPYKFISPWKKGSPYYYPPASVGYALYFHAGGYFIHDAPWRTVFGPGTNTAPGPPGVYSGTHGCINVPTDVAQWLYTWAPVGTVMQVVK